MGLIIARILLGKASLRITFDSRALLECAGIDSYIEATGVGEGGRQGKNCVLIFTVDTDAPQAYGIDQATRFVEEKVWTNEIKS